jgi:hypothetical protein
MPLNLCNFKVFRLKFCMYFLMCWTRHLNSASWFDHSFIHQWLYSLLLGPGLFFSFVIFFYTDGRTPWTSDQPVARPLPKHRTKQTQNKRTHRHPCLEWDSNPWSQRSSERRQIYALDRAATVIGFWCDYINKIHWKIQIMKLLIMLYYILLTSSLSDPN